MPHHHIPHIQEILVAASAAQLYGFSKTQDALKELARCATCPHMTRCDGLYCLRNNARTERASADWIVPFPRAQAE